MILYLLPPTPTVPLLLLSLSVPVTHMTGKGPGHYAIVYIIVIATKEHIAVSALYRIVITTRPSYCV